jgi:pimeloyl-ACP methyl ester carboxylesterase
MENKINMNFDLKNTQEVLTSSGDKVWQQGFVIRKVSKFITGTSEDAVMPIPVFYDPKIATKAIVDEVYAMANDRIKLIKTLTIAKSAIRHNMAKDLPKMHVPTCIIWGKNDSVTPPHVAEEFDKLMPNSTLYWIDQCGHAAMMEHPDTFNQLMHEWLKKVNL